jgi:hypothetical protein
LLPTGRLFGRISKKEPNKKWSGRGNLRPNQILADFEQKEPKGFFLESAWRLAVLLGILGFKKCSLITLVR